MLGEAAGQLSAGVKDKFPGNQVTPSKSGPSMTGLRRVTARTAYPCRRSWRTWARPCRPLAQNTVTVLMDISNPILGSGHDVAAANASGTHICAT
ncbi:MAG: hypothetical protein ACLPQY_18400 [Streptosporangiaceae bacterium]